MAMDNDVFNVIKILVIVAIIFVAVARKFMTVFVKPFIPTPGQGKQGGGRGKDLKDFIEELRRDLGHGETPPPRTDGLLDGDEGAHALPEEAPAHPLGIPPQHRREAFPQQLHMPDQQMHDQQIPDQQLPGRMDRPSMEHLRRVRERLAGTPRARSEADLSRAAHRAEANQETQDALSVRRVAEETPESSFVAALAETSVTRDVAAFESTVTAIGEAHKQARSTGSILGVEIESAMALQEVLDRPRASRPWLPRGMSFP